MNKIKNTKNKQSPPNKQTQKVSLGHFQQDLGMVHGVQTTYWSQSTGCHNPKHYQPSTRDMNSDSCK